MLSLFHGKHSAPAFWLCGFPCQPEGRQNFGSNSSRANASIVCSSKKMVYLAGQKVAPFNSEPFRHMLLWAQLLKALKSLKSRNHSYLKTLAHYRHFCCQYLQWAGCALALGLLHRIDIHLLQRFFAGAPTSPLARWASP